MQYVPTMNIYSHGKKKVPPLSPLYAFIYQGLKLCGLHQLLFYFLKKTKKQMISDDIK